MKSTNEINIILICLFALLSVVSADWWENGNFYQIYPRSFKDSDGDGIGDLNGITSKLEYLRDIGITGTWLSPIFQSPQADFGYDISDFTKIHWEYGTLKDFEQLAAKCRELNIRLILDFVPNHTSDEHEWFIKSEANDPEYKDYYIWHPGKMVDGVRSPPNNWISVFRFSAWKWSDKRQAYYLHQFAEKQPDLNYRNPKVVEAMKNILRLWLSRGVTGFRIDAVPYLYEVEADADGNYPDEPLSGNCDDPESYCYLSHVHTQDKDETFDMIYQWRKVLDDFKTQNGGESRIIMTEAYTSLENTLRFYVDETGTRNGSHIPFNFELINHMNMDSTASDFKSTIESWINNMPAGKYYPNWVMGNHDNKRLASRFGPARADLLNILLQTLPGVAVTYNGEELGLEDVHISWEETLDPQACNTNPTDYHTFSRDPARTPFPWDAGVNAGFSAASKTWLPVASDYITNNVQAQQRASNSHLKIFKALTFIRKLRTFRQGSLELKLVDNDVLMYRRHLEGYDSFIIVLNFSQTPKTIDLTQQFASLPARLEVIVSSLGSSYNIGDKIPSNSMNAEAQKGVVLVAVGK